VTERIDGQAMELFAPVDVVRREEPEGIVYLDCGTSLPPSAPSVCAWIAFWARTEPERICVAERDGAGWRSLTYAQVFARVRTIASWLVANGAGAERPVAILSENSVDHWLLAYACMYAGIPVATISTAYSLMSTDHQKLRSMIELLTPAVIMVSDTGRYSAALKAIEGWHEALLIASYGRDSVPISNLDAHAALDEADMRFAAIAPGTVARLLFTSGSTGTPKAVVNTHGMLTSNQAANRAVCPVLGRDDLVFLDWLPWSHTFGANFMLNMSLANGGSYYIDDGKPAPGLIERTITNLKEIRPSAIFNVPRGYEMLLAAAERDRDFAKVLFDSKFLFYAAAALPGWVWDRLMELSVSTTGKSTPLVAAWGATETSPLATYCHFQAEKPGNIGVPVPGTTLKLKPNGGKLEVRVKGPQVTLGYFRNLEKTAEAFDEEGFYIMGDAVRFADPEDPSKGLYFDGRVSEDFKLTSGTWVSVGSLRIAGIDALSPLAQDIVVAGHDRDYVGFLVVPNEAACRNCSDLPPDAPIEDILASDAVRKIVSAGLAKLKAAGGGSSRYAARARFLATTPNPDNGEITDKAYLNQRQMLANRKEDVDFLFGDEPDAFITP